MGHETGRKKGYREKGGFDFLMTVVPETLISELYIVSGASHHAVSDENGFSTDMGDPVKRLTQGREPNQL